VTFEIDGPLGAADREPFPNRDDALSVVQLALIATWPDFLLSAPSEHIETAKAGALRTADSMLVWLDEHDDERNTLLEWLTR